MLESFILRLGRQVLLQRLNHPYRITCHKAGLPSLRLLSQLLLERHRAQLCRASFVRNEHILHVR